jgi:aminomuconate-semialdehyde/2-hydroxymuconate-6-semialdehyde dehydrogenase
LSTQAENLVKSVDSLHFINGEYVPSLSGKVKDNINPATEEVISQISQGGQEEVNEAVAAAKKALKGPWKKFTLDERIAVIRKIGDIILERKDELARLESLDTGKPIWLSTAVDISRSAFNFHFFADYLRSVGTEAYETDDVAINYSVRRPVGVVGIISPWNLPLLLMTWKLAPALAAGNTVVVKPASLTPTTATIIGEICKEAGVPDGVVNIVNGSGSVVGTGLTEHKDVDAITFTGETSTGQTIMAAGAKTLKKLSYELGGKNPNIIFADADLDEVIDTTLKSSFINQGEVCLCGSRIYVERSAYDEFIEKFVARTKELVVGDPFDPKTKVGALVGKDHYERVLSYIELAKEEGQVILFIDELHQLMKPPGKSRSRQAQPAKLDREGRLRPA